MLGLNHNKHCYVVNCLHFRALASHSAARTQLLVTATAMVGALALAWSSLVDKPSEIEPGEKSIAAIGS
jgi:hypothetical protein